MNEYKKHPASPPTNSKVVPPYIPPPIGKEVKLWCHSMYEMSEYDDFSKSRNQPAYVRAENYYFILRRCKNIEEDNASLKAEVERLNKAIMDSVEMRQRLREIEGKQS